MMAKTVNNKKRREYQVTWSIDLAATSPREAAQKALEIQRDPESIATVLGVRAVSGGPTVQIDLQAKTKESCACEQPGPFNGGLPGILARVSNDGKILSAVERCDACELFTGDEAAERVLRAHLTRLRRKGGEP
jgi:hypothetical protein